jgi:hypothetical protein
MMEEGQERVGGSYRDDYDRLAKGQGDVRPGQPVPERIRTTRANSANGTWYGVPVRGLGPRHSHTADLRERDSRLALLDAPDRAPVASWLVRQSYFAFTKPARVAGGVDAF